MTGHQQQFVEEIDYNEIETEQVLVYLSCISPRSCQATARRVPLTYLTLFRSLVLTAKARFVLLSSLRGIRSRQDNLKRGRTISSYTRE